jgi:beta-glucosidase-like glycosyl hydrolase
MASRRRTTSTLPLLLPALLLLLLPITPTSAQQVEGNTCNSSSPSQQWRLDPVTGHLTSASHNFCLTAEGGAFPVADGTALLLMPCGQAGVDPRAQSFAWNTSFSMGLVLAADPSKCVNLAGYGTSPGTQVWLYGCVPPAYQCDTNCAWANGTAPAASSTIVNPPSGLCLDDGGATVLPRTCAPGSPAASFDMCNITLPFPARVADLVARLSLPYKLSLLMLPLPVSLDALVNETLGLAGFWWDVTLIHGISTTYFVQPLPNATSFPHSIAQAASFDVPLAQSIAAATAYEARAVNARNFVLSGGRAFQALLAEGGSLCNSAADPRWGRTQETHGEDPVQIATFAQAFTLALQNETAGAAGGVAPGNPPFLQISAVARHFLGYHGANDLPNNGEEWVTPQFLADHHLPPYEAVLAGAGADGVMCSINTLRVGPGDGSAGGIPACVDPLLYGILWGSAGSGDGGNNDNSSTPSPSSPSPPSRGWSSSAFVQSDNEAIVPMYTTHAYYKTLQEAVVGFVQAGGIGIDSGLGTEIVAALANATALGLVTEAQVDAYVSRQFLTRMRLGEFDIGANPAYPFPPDAYDMAEVDGPAHRALARDAVRKSLTLLINRNATLPLLASSPPASVAVLGPWADVPDREGGYGCNAGYLGNYATTTSVVSTIFDAAVEAWPSPATNVTFSLGTNPYTLSSPTGIADAAAVAANSDLTLLALGLGCGIETEGVDRPDLYLPPVQDELLAAVAQAVAARRAQGLPARLVLVTVSAGLVDLDESLVDAWVQLFIPGEEAGHGLLDVLTGAWSPSGRLPLTLYASEYLEFAGPIADFNLVSQTSGVGRTYRYANAIPDGLIKHGFGFGLSYASFLYAGMEAQVVAAHTGPVTAVVVNFTVAHAAGMSSIPVREVVQVYVRGPAPPASQPPLSTPIHSLQAFAVVTVTAGGPAATVSVTLPYPDAFAYTLLDGSRAVAGGDYVLFASGHQPGDVDGEVVSNVVSTTVTLPASVPVPPPWNATRTGGEGGGASARPQAMERGALLRRVRVG